MSYKVIYADKFEKELKKLSKKYRSLKQDLSELIASLEENPTQGKVIGGECYKIRLAITSKGKGKSAGARVITHVYIHNNTVFLLSIYDKSDKDNLTDKEIKLLLATVEY